MFQEYLHVAFPKCKLESVISEKGVFRGLSVNASKTFLCVNEKKLCKTIKNFLKEGQKMYQVFNIMAALFSVFLCT